MLCAEGAIDMGLTGSDLVAEHRADTIERLPLDVGHCRLAICVPENGDVREPRDLAGRRIATSFPNTTQEYLEKHHTTAHMVPLSGSVEVMIALGVADAIVDLVETGSTLAANGLKILDEIGHYKTVLIQNRECRHPELADRVVRRLEGVVIARTYSLLEYNVPRGKLAEAEKITPGFNSPTVAPGRFQLVPRARHGPPRRSDRDHGAARGAGRERHPGNADYELPAVTRSPRK